MKRELPTCVSCSSLNLCVFKSCTEHEVLNVITSKSCRTYKKDQNLYLEGEKPQGLFCISRGKVKVIKTNRDGKEQIISIVGRGANLGYHAIILNENYGDSAIIIEEADICFIPKNNFLELIYNNQNLNIHLMHLIASDFVEIEQRLKQMSFKSVRERLADAFFILKKVYNHNDNSELQLAISRRDLANIVGTAKETTARLLTEFKDDNIINMVGRDINVMDWVKLKKISQKCE
jgi:CRP-like cAMP-binding protein